VIFVDSNVPMYLIGADHPHKHDARRLLEAFVADRRRLVSSAEVLQEILHRYRAIDRPSAIQPAVDALLGVTDEVLPIEARDVLAAKDVLVAVMQRHGIDEVLSFDRHFDLVPGVRRHC
jgi:predicted nucleic acid-binding protein